MLINETRGSDTFYCLSAGASGSGSQVSPGLVSYDDSDKAGASSGGTDTVTQIGFRHALMFPIFLGAAVLKCSYFMIYF